MTRPGGAACIDARAKYTEVLFAENRRRKWCAAQAAITGDGPILGTTLGMASLDSTGLYRAPRPPRHLGPGRGRFFEEAGGDVCLPGEGRAPRRRRYDGEAGTVLRVGGHDRWRAGHDKFVVKAAWKGQHLGAGVAHVS